VKNNYLKEDENSEDYIACFNELLKVKVTSFVNLVVCKYKLKEYESIINITEQIIEMDPNNTKALYFRGKAYLETQEYAKAVDSLTNLCRIDPNHSDGRAELERAKKVKKDFQEGQTKLYSKFFGDN
jgi:peptidyl-prolyl isomerase D